MISKDELSGNNNSRLHAATSVTTITSKGLAVSDQSNGNIETVGRAASWAVSFDKLLQDKVGIVVFTVSIVGSSCLFCMCVCSLFLCVCLSACVGVYVCVCVCTL